MIKRMFGDIKAFQHDPLELFLDKTNSAPAGLVRLALGPKPVYLVTDPELVKPILKMEENLIDKGRLVTKLRSIVGKGTLTLSGDDHAKRRAIAHKRFARGVALDYVPAMTANILQIGVQLQKEKQFDALEAGNHLALRLISTALFGKQVLSAADENALLKVVDELEHIIARDMFRILPKSPWQWRRDQKQLAQGRHALSTIISKIRRSASPDSVLNSLIEAELTDAEIHDELVTLLLAGYHTTGSAIGWLFITLASQPGLTEIIQKDSIKIYEEHGDIDASKLSQAIVSRQTISEVLRLYPPAWWFSRELKQQIKIGEKLLKKGTTLIIAPWQLHRDARFWDNPDTFQIDRNFSSAAFLPFGAGKRVCAGMGYAMLELQLVAVVLCSMLSFKCEETGDFSPNAAILMTPPEVKITCEFVSLSDQSKVKQAVA